MRLNFVYVGYGLFVINALLALNNILNDNYFPLIFNFIGIGCAIYIVHNARKINARRKVMDEELDLIKEKYIKANTRVVSKKLKKVVK